MIKLTLPSGQSTVVESIGGKILVENATGSEARSFMKRRNAGPSVSSTTTSSSPPEVREVRKGDLVQWTSGGVDQFKEPLEITRIKKGFAFFKGSETGAPLEELNVHSKEGGI